MSWIIDTEVLARHLITPVLAKASHLEWVRVLISPVASLNNHFVEYREEVIKRMQYNGQVIILENLLNDLFQPSEREIYIETEDDRLSQLYIFQTSEQEPSEFIHQTGEAPPLYIFQDGEQLAVGYDFIVWVPDGILTPEDVARLKAVVRRYKLAGKIPAYRYFSGQFF